MLVWNDLQTVIEHRLYFTKIRYIHNDVDGEKNYIFFYDGKNPYNQGYIDMWTRYVYWNGVVWDLNKTIFESDIPLVLYIYGSDEANNNYQFWSEQTQETDDEGEVLPPNAIKIEEYYIRCQEKEQVRPKDLTQDWKDTNNIRNVECGEVETELCSCGTQYRWVESGTICDGVNKHQRLRFQYKYDCDSEWVNYDPDIYKIGELIELDSSECGTYEYKEEWEGNWYCGSDLNELYNLRLDETSKYMVKKAYIKKKNESVWTELECETLLEYSLYKENSFECGYKTTKTIYEYDYDLCGSFVEENYGISGLIHTNLYNVRIKYTYETAPYPTNTDDMEEEEWSWVLIDTEYSATLSNRDDCGCGYYYLQWDETDEYACGSVLGDGYKDTTQYRKYIEAKYCEDNLLEYTGNFEYREYDSTSCECGYRRSGYTEMNNTFEYICVPSGETIVDSFGTETTSTGSVYTKMYYYEECVDGSNRVFYPDKWKYGKVYQYSTSAVTTCEYDEQTKGNTTKVVTTYRTYWDVNEGAYKVMDCIEPTIDKYKKSADCGYKEKWNKVDEVCCGYLGEQYEITHSDGLGTSSGYWYKNGGVYSPYPLTSTGETQILKIYFMAADGVTLNIKKNTSTQYIDIYYALDSEDFREYTESSSFSKNYTINDTEEHYIAIKVIYQSGSYLNYLPQISLSLYGGCEEFAKYELLNLKYSIDGGNTYISTDEYKYGIKISSKDPDCGYVPVAEQWVEICPNITYNDVVINGVLNDPNGCTACFNIEGSLNALYSLQKRQESRDLGLTWYDVYPMETRMFRLLRKDNTELGNACNVDDV